jgi:hypothetical protein
MPVPPIRLSDLPGVLPGKRRRGFMKLTAQVLAKFQWPDKPDHIVFDDDIAGFGLRRREGRQSWVFQYAIGAGGARVTRRIKIGDYPALSPGKAREEAQDLHAKVHLHGDPAVERRKNRVEAGKTVGRLVCCSDTMTAWCAHTRDTFLSYS